MQRRAFLTTIGAAALASRTKASQPKTGRQTIQLTVDLNRKLAVIPADFLGLGYEISSVAIPDLLSSQDETYVQLVRTLSPRGVIRIGGNTADYASFRPNAKALSAPKQTAINENSLQQLASFLKATNWRLIWGLNLGSADIAEVVAEAVAVDDIIKAGLLAFEIGNEPDLFGRGTAHRPGNYSYGDFIQEFRRYKNAIRAKLPHAPFAGPDVASATTWVTQFAKDEQSDLKLLTHHYYRECVGRTSTLDKLLTSDPKLAPELETLRLASSNSGVPYRLCETNSFCGGGQPGVSDSFGAALWVLDFLFQLASAGCAGVNMETGVNQIGFVSSYSPIRQNERGVSLATPEYYGMLAFAQASRGTLVTTNYDAGATKISAYAVLNENRTLSITVINKDASLDADVRLSLPQTLHHGRVFRLVASSLQAQEGVTFGGSRVSPDGTWKLSQVAPLNLAEGSIAIPAASAAVLQFAP